MELKQIVNAIIQGCPTHNENIKIGIGKDLETCWIFSRKNDTWWWFFVYSMFVEEILTKNGFKWAYAFEMVENDYPYVIMFITKGDIKSKVERLIGDVFPIEKVPLVSSSFMDVCEQYNDAYNDEMSQSIMGIASDVFEVYEV